MKEWRVQFHKNILSQGKEYYERGRVFELQEKEGVYTATVIERKNYDVRIIARADAPYNMSCRCPLAKGGGNCRHMAAVLYAIEAGEQAGEAVVNDEIKTGAEDAAIVPESNEETMRTDTSKADEGEYFILNHSGLQKEVPREQEEKKRPDIQEKYFYYDFNRIWKSAEFSGKAVKRGMQLLASNSIEMREITAGYLSDKDEQVAVAEATGLDGKWKFPIEVTFSRTQILHVGCRCRECQNNYWRYMNKDYCAYTYAVMKRTGSYQFSDRDSDSEL